MDKLLTLNEKLEEIAHLQALEGNPLTAEERAMFERFDREGWSLEQEHDYILAKIKAFTADPK